MGALLRVNIGRKFSQNRFRFQLALTTLFLFVFWLSPGFVRGTHVVVHSLCPGLGRYPVGTPVIEIDAPHVALMFLLYTT